MRATIGRKLTVLVALEFAALALVLTLAGSQMREALMSERRLMLQQLVDTADSIVKRHAELAQRGELTAEAAQAEALAEVGALRFGDNNYVWVNDFDLQMLQHPSATLRGTNVTDYAGADGKRFFVEMLGEVKRHGAGYVEYQWRRSEKADPALKISYARATSWNWIVATGMYADDVAATALDRTLKLAVLLVVVAIALLGLTAFLARSITRPLRATVASLQDLATGDCDLSRELPEHERDELGALGHAFNQFVRNLRGLISESRSVAGRVTDASAELAGVAGEVTAATQSQAAGLEETAASLEEITATVKQNADSARQVNELAARSLNAAEQGGVVVGQAITAMEDINAASKKIADIIATIDGIAFQTNLLALNAAVEAARAGEHGRGFAVVASEVQGLAQRSAAAAREIKTLIQDSVAKIGTGSALVNRSGETLQEIVASVKHVTEIIASIAMASEEQSAGVDQVNQALSEMDHGVQQTASQIAALSDTAETLSGDAAQLAALVGRFKLEASERRAQTHCSEQQYGLDFGKAVQAHIDWKMRLRDYVGHPDGSLHAQDVARCDACALGKWLQGGGRQWANQSEYGELVQQHARFHEEAGAIVRLADARQAHEATERLGAQSAFTRVSTEVVRLIKRLEAKLCAAAPEQQGKATRRAA